MPGFARWSKNFLNSFGGQVLLTTSANLLLAFFALITGGILARLLGSQGRGELAAIQTWGALVALLASLGLPDAVVYFTGRDPDRGATYLVTAAALACLGAIPFTAAGYFLMPILLAAQRPVVVNTARWYVIGYAFLMATQGMLIHPLRGRKDFVGWNLLRLLYAASWLAAILTVWASQNQTASRMAIAQLLSLLVAGVLGWMLVRSRTPGPFSLQPRLWGAMARYGLPSVLSILPQMLNLRLDQLLMAAFFPTQLLGYYVVAVAWSAVMTPFIQGIGSVLFPRVASQTETSLRLSLLGRSLRLGVLLTGLLSLVVSGFTPFAIWTIFGAEYAPAIPAALILVVAGGVANLNIVLGEGLRGLGLPKAVFWSEIVGLIGTLAGLALLLRPLEIVGAALASLCGYTIVTVVLILWLGRVTGETVFFFLLPRWEDVQIARQWFGSLMRNIL